MHDDVLMEEIHAAFVAAFIFAGPVLIIGTAIGVVVAILQAVTQIQEQSIGQSIKIIVISIMLITAGTRLSAALVAYGEHVFTEFPRLVP